MFTSVLIANRGEIACRIIRTAQRLGLRTIAVYSQADAGALHVALADEAHCIGPASPQHSYLCPDHIIMTALGSGAECVHPGYGFLAENAKFAAACANAGLTFVGPSPEAIRLMGAKDEAKALMAKAGVPVVPGYHGKKQGPAFLAQRAKKLGFPVMLKPVAGGGGKGMRAVTEHSAFAEALESARREAKAASGDDRMIIEKLIERPRHIEIQILADSHGKTVHLFERDCSLQRRHQKVIEEAPAPDMDEALRDRMGAAAVAAASAVDYSGAGTVEFIVEGRKPLREAAFYFMEMNTRLQVEHPVTERVTGLDLVEWQLRIASGEKLPMRQDEIALSGHAVEARLYAEDPARGFLPSTGMVHALDLPDGPGIRVDTGIRAGDAVTPHYDPMLAKIIALGTDRAEAIGRLTDALSKTRVAGPRTNLRFLHDLLGNESFAAGQVDTELIARAFGDYVVPEPSPGIIAAGALALVGKQQKALKRRAGTTSGTSPWDSGDAFSLGGLRRVPMAVEVDGARRELTLIWSDTGPSVEIEGIMIEPEAGADVVLTGSSAFVLHDMLQTEIRPARHLRARQSGGEGGEDVVRAPMHGRLVATFVRAGDVVEQGKRLAVLEAMKMEHTLHAGRTVRIGEIRVKKGAQIEEGTVIMTLEDPAEAGIR